MLFALWFEDCVNLHDICSVNYGRPAYADIIFLPCGFFFMVALCNRADHYIFILWFLLLLSSFFLFPRLIAAVGDWMSTILPHMVRPYCKFRMQVWNVLQLHPARWNTGRKKSHKKSPSAHHRTTLSGHISSQVRHVSTIGKKLVKQQYVLQMPPQYGEAAEIVSLLWGTPPHFNWFCVLAALLLDM